MKIENNSKDVLTEAVKLYETVTGNNPEEVNISYIMGFVDCYRNYSGDYKAGYKQAIIDGKTNCSRHQGNWIFKQGLMSGGYYKCDVCGGLARYETNYCSNCGAYMKGNYNG